MTAEELQRLLTEAPWFSNNGGLATTIRSVDDLHDEHATWWDWLPTSREQSDLLHGDALSKLAADTGRDEQRKAAELEALASLRPLPEHVPGLGKVPHDLSVAAKGAAVYVDGGPRDHG